MERKREHGVRDGVDDGILLPPKGPMGSLFPGLSRSQGCTDSHSRVLGPTGLWYTHRVLLEDTRKGSGSLGRRLAPLGVPLFISQYLL